MGYDRGDSFPFDFAPNGYPFGSKSKGKLSPRSYPIQCERKWKHSFLSAAFTFDLANKSESEMLPFVGGISARPVSIPDKLLLSEGAKN